MRRGENNHSSVVSAAFASYAGSYFVVRKIGDAKCGFIIRIVVGIAIFFLRMQESHRLRIIDAVRVE